MKEILTQYASYNLWANKLFTGRMGQLTHEQQQVEAAASFSSVYKTVVHMLETEEGWYKRLHLSEEIYAPGVKSGLSIEEVIAALIRQSTLYISWIDKARTEKLEHVVAYRNSKRTEFKQPVYQMLMHLFNHQTYHRGQLVCILRQLGESNIPNSDLINWYRLKQPGA